MTTWTHRNRRLLIGAGIVLLLSSVLLDVARGVPVSFGRLQLASAMLGTVLLLLGTFDTTVSSLWKGTALVLLNTIVLLILLNVAAKAAMKRLPRERYLGTVTLPWYAAQPWNTAYRAEYPKVIALYRWTRWMMWEGAPFKGALINVNDEGRRVTPGDECRAGAFVIWAFGGSTMWGYGAPDSLTIPALLHHTLDTRQDRPVCVVNHSERAYNSTQQVMRLERELRRRRRPDLVVFYDGLNDANYAMRSGEPGSFQDERAVEKRVYNTAPFTAWFQSIALPEFALELRRRASGADTTPGFRALGINADSLAVATADVHDANHRTVAALGVGYGFDVLFFLQPMIALGNKKLIAEEQSVSATMTPTVRTFFRTAFDAMLAASKREFAGTPVAPLIDLRDAFDSEGQAIYFDWFHVTPVGNVTVARRIAQSIQSRASFSRYLSDGRPAAP